MEELASHSKQKFWVEHKLLRCGELEFGYKLPALTQLLVIVIWLVEGLETQIVINTSGRYSYSSLYYFEINPYLFARVIISK